MVCKKRVESIFEVPTDNQVELTKQEIGEHHERMQVQVESVKDYVLRQFDVDLQANIVRNYLRGAKHDPEKAKRKLENYLALQKRQPEVFAGRDPTDKSIQRAMNSVNLVFLPKLTENGDRISVFSLASKDPADFEPLPLSKLIFMIMDLIMTSESPVSGEILIFDAQGVTTNHVMKLLQPTLARALFTTLRSAYCFRIKSIHIVNAPPLLGKFLNVIRPMCHEKIRNRFIVHENEQNLQQYLPARLLPEDFGGQLDSISELMSKWRNVIEENSDWFQSQEEKLSKFQTNQWKSTPSLGVEGTFRKLAID